MFIDKSLNLIWKTMMKRTKSLIGRIAATTFAVGIATCVPQTQVNAAYLGEVGFYGAVPLAPGLTPRLWYANPIIAVGAAIGLAPLYLHVPPLHRLHWVEYCGLYGACYSPVYFIYDDWYRYTYVPYYLRHWGRPGPYGPGPRGPVGPGPGARPGGAAPMAARPGGAAPMAARPGGASGVSTMSARQGGVPVPNQIRSNTVSSGVSTMSARSAGGASPATMRGPGPATMSSRSGGGVSTMSSRSGGGFSGGARGGGGGFGGGARGGGGGGRR